MDPTIQKKVFVIFLTPNFEKKKQFFNLKIEWLKWFVGPKNAFQNTFLDILSAPYTICPYVQKKIVCLKKYGILTLYDPEILKVFVIHLEYPKKFSRMRFWDPQTTLTIRFLNWKKNVFFQNLGVKKIAKNFFCIVGSKNDFWTKFLSITNFDTHLFFFFRGKQNLL